MSICRHNSTINTIPHLANTVPISKDRFEEMGRDGEGTGPTPGTNAAKILSFLRDHPDKAFTQSEIAEATDVKTGSVGPTLYRLHERGRVDHRGTYWRVSDHNEAVTASTYHGAASAAARETDDDIPRMEAWQDSAVDPRNHRNAQ